MSNDIHRVYHIQKVQINRYLFAWQFRVHFTQDQKAVESKKATEKEREKAQNRFNKLQS